MSGLRLEAVKRVLEAAVAKAAELGANFTVAVMDDGGHLLGLYRMDGALLAGLESAQVKAHTAVFFGTPTRNLPMDKPFTPALLGASSYPIAMIPGEVPLSLEGRIVGGIGVGGGTAEQDEAVAMAGQRAL